MPHLPTTMGVHVLVKHTRRNGKDDDTQQVFEYIECSNLDEGIRRCFSELHDAQRVPYEVTACMVEYVHLPKPRELSDGDLLNIFREQGLDV